MTLMAVIASEWTKIRTVRSTAWTLLLAFVICIGLSALVSFSFTQALAGGPRDGLRFDPLFATFYGVTLGQLALVVFGVLTVTGEYSSGTIRASLAAVPRRGIFYLGKVLAVAAVVAVVSLLTSVATFFTGHSVLGRYATALGDSRVPGAIAGTCVYLLLICLFSMGVATMLRSSVGALAILLPLLFLGSQGLGNLPAVKPVAQYLPDQAGMLLMHVSGPADDPVFGRAYGPWTAVVILVLWAAASLSGGYLMLRRRDA